jgi:hypothetical protein
MQHYLSQGYTTSMQKSTNNTLKINFYTTNSFLKTIPDGPNSSTSGSCINIHAPKSLADNL